VESLPPQAREKLEQKVIDFERLDEAELQDGKWDVVFITYVSFPASLTTFWF
jgi:oxidoreductase